MGRAGEESYKGGIVALVSSLDWHGASSSHRSVVHPSTTAESTTIARLNSSATRVVTISWAIPQDSRGNVGVRCVVFARGDWERITGRRPCARHERRCAESASTQSRATRHGAVIRPNTQGMRPPSVARRVVGVDLRRLNSHATTSAGVAVNRYRCSLSPYSADSDVCKRTPCFGEFTRNEESE
jgi:hypothetical protein